MTVRLGRRRRRLPAAGCGSATPGASLGRRPRRSSGKVTYKGKPLVRGTVVFEPDGPGREAHGRDPARRHLRTLHLQASGDGAVVGTHRVSVAGERGKSGKDNVPLKYKGYASSKIEPRSAQTGPSTRST